MARRDDIVAFADDLLQVARFPEYGPPGLQVVGAAEVSLAVGGVSASLELFERAADAGAQLVLVHHGLFWRNEPLVVDRRLRGRLEALFRADATLLAYHLALDAHPELGNNAQLARALGVEVERPFGGVGVGGRIAAAAADDVVRRVRDVCLREPVVFPFGPEQVERVAVQTGGGGYDLVQAAREGYDLYVTGEPEEPNYHAARELGIHLVAAGHHATERLGVQELGRRIGEEFGIEFRYLEVENPV